MTFIGNLLWFAFGGIWMGLLWLLVGLACCSTIIGIPFGVACFQYRTGEFCAVGQACGREVMKG